MEFKGHRTIITTTLVCVLVGVTGLPSRKRAVPYPYHDVHTRTSTTEHTTTGCPVGQLLQTSGNHSVCCQPVNCNKGYGINTCSEDGGRDECALCQNGYLQPNQISSFNMEEAVCFKDPYFGTNYYCAIEDTKPSSHQPVNCGLYCECKTEKCYVGIACGCTRVDPCGLDQQLNRHTTKCEPCPQYSFKHYIGCGPCIYNITAFSLGMTTQSPGQTSTSTVHTTDTVTNKSRHEVTSVATPPTDKQDLKFTEILLIVLVVFLVFIVVFILILVYRRPQPLQPLIDKICSRRGGPSSSSHISSSDGTVRGQTLKVVMPAEEPLLNEGATTGTTAVGELSTTTPDLPNSPDSGFGSQPCILPSSIPVTDTSGDDNSEHSNSIAITGSYVTPSSDSFSRPELGESSVHTGEQAETFRKTSDKPNFPDPVTRTQLVNRGTNIQSSSLQWQEFIKPSTSENCKGKPVAKVGPFRACDDETHSHCSSITSYPEMHDDSSIARIEDLSSQFGDSDMAGDCNDEAPPVINSQGEAVTTHRGQEMFSVGHETELKDIVPSDETLQKSVYDLDSTYLKETHPSRTGQCVPHNAHGEDINFEKLTNEMSEMKSGNEDMVSHTVANASNGNNTVKEVSKREAADSFSGSLPSGSSVEISLSGTQFRSEDDSVEIELDSRLDCDEGSREGGSGVSDSQQSVILPYSVRQPGDGAFSSLDTDNQESVEPSLNCSQTECFNL